MFIYNKMHVRHLISDGYVAKNATADLDFLQQRMNLILPRSSPELPVTAKELVPLAPVE